MIGYLEGTLIYKEPPELLLNVNGVGYELEASLNTHYNLPDISERVALYVHMTVREDAHKLYGFCTLDERSLFRTLIKVNGVGPKLALQVLSSLTPDQFIARVQNEDISSLTKLPGIGKKTAERLLIEVRDKLKDKFVSSPLTGGVGRESKPVEDAVSALQSLGYGIGEIKPLLKQMKLDELDTQSIIKEALKELATLS